jgi:hypothetical protein
MSYKGSSLKKTSSDAYNLQSAGRKKLKKSKQYSYLKRKSLRRKETGKL